jgi:disease resistance protein RPM1
MDLVTEAMASLLPKLVELLKEEYKLQEGVKKDLECLSEELGSTRAALLKVAEAVPGDMLDEQVRFWAIDARELSYDMEDVVDSFLVHAEGSEPASRTQTLVELMKKMTALLEKGKTHRQIAHAISDIRDQIPDVVAHGNPASTTNIILDPCLLALCKVQKEIVGIEGARDEVVRRLTDEDDGDAPKKQLKTLSLLGIDGLGKTTLAKAVYDCLRVQFEYGAFVRVGRSSNMQKVFKDVLAELKGYEDASILEESQLIDKLRGLLENKRYVRRHSTSIKFNVMYFKQ